MNNRWSGKVNIDYDIERYKNKETGELILEKDLPDDCNEDFKYELVTIPLFIRGSSSFTPGKFYGPPENSYPDEGDTEISSIEDYNGNDWESHLTNYELNDIINKITEEAQTNN